MKTVFIEQPLLVIAVLRFTMRDAQYNFRLPATTRLLGRRHPRAATVHYTSFQHHWTQLTSTSLEFISTGWQLVCRWLERCRAWWADRRGAARPRDLCSFSAMFDRSILFPSRQVFRCAFRTREDCPQVFVRHWWSVLRIYVMPRVADNPRNVYPVPLSAILQSRKITLSHATRQLHLYSERINVITVNFRSPNADAFAVYVYVYQ